MFYKACPQPCLALFHQAMLHSQGQAALQTPDRETNSGLPFTLGVAAGHFLPDAHGIPSRAALDTTDNAHTTLLLQGLWCWTLPVPLSPATQLCLAVMTARLPPDAAAGPFSPDTRRFFQGVKKASQAMAVKQAQRLEAEASGSSIRRAQEEADRCVRASSVVVQVHGQACSSVLKL